MAVVMDDMLKAKLERVQKREWWPVALLAEVLGRPKCFIYRLIDEGNFVISEDGGPYKRVLSNSVISYYEKKVFDD